MKTAKTHPPISRIFFFMLTLMLWNCGSSADLILPAEKEIPMQLKSGKITAEEYLCNPQSAPLITIQNHSIGMVNLLTDMNGHMVISVSVKNGWSIQDIQLYVGDLDNIPKDSEGNPSPDSFAQTAFFNPGQTNYSVLLAPAGFYNVDGIIYCAVAIHAHVAKINKNGRCVQSEEVWIAGEKISPGLSWATFYPYERIPCSSPPQ